MGNHTVHRSTETGNFVVADKEGKILHTFPSEGEAEAQVRSLDEQEKAAKEAAKDEAKADKAEAKNEKHENDKPHVAGRHR